MKSVSRRILVASSTMARFFDHLGVGKGLAEIEDKMIERDYLRAQDIQSDAAGRSFASHGDGSSAMEPKTDPTAKAQKDFATELAGRLDVDATNKEFENLIIIAAPSMLGDIRNALSDGVKKKVEHELAKDLTHIPPSKIGKHLDDLLVV
ncbi:host attachment protein [uncultured Maritalea sp.]|jgi:protein required for attachment to host cells|uniref:host attachment protein n=1 Tax=uncultured Maritalea sp. TaxID=757249 RepID=UPI00262B0182|nr:host attachment protein [uncultured Maritalea sp.]